MMESNHARATTTTTTTTTTAGTVNQVVSLQFQGKTIVVNNNNPQDQVIEDAFWSLESRHHLFGVLGKEDFNRNREHPPVIEDKALNILINSIRNLEDQKNLLKIKDQELYLLQKEKGSIDNNIHVHDISEEIATLEKKLYLKKMASKEAEKADHKYLAYTVIKKRLSELNTIKKNAAKSGNTAGVHSVLAEIKKIEEQIHVGYLDLSKLDKDIEELESNIDILKKQKEIIDLKEKITRTETSYEALSPQKKDLVDFIIYNKDYQKKLTLYKQLFRLCKAIADQVESNSNGNDTLAAENAYKMLALFEGKDLTDTINNFARYVRQSGLTSNKLVHDAFSSVTLPQEGQAVTLSRWRQFVNDHGLPAIKLFAIADKIEKKNAELSHDDSANSHKAPNSLPEATELKTMATYPKAGTNPLLAKVCAENNVTESVFNRCLEITMKSKDNLPVVTIDGANIVIPAAATAAAVTSNTIKTTDTTELEAELGFIKLLVGRLVGAKDTTTSAKTSQHTAAKKPTPSTTTTTTTTTTTAPVTAATKSTSLTSSATPQVMAAKGYWLVKLPVDDPRAFILGQITDCCQSIDGHSEVCVIDGVTRENNGFYVLLHSKPKGDKRDNQPIKNGKIDYDNYEIVGQGYAWLSEANNLVFDSWENLRPNNDNPIVVEMLKAFAMKITEAEGSNVSRVMIGDGGKTPGEFRHDAEEQKPYPDTMREGYQYGDSRNQLVVYESYRLIEKRGEIKQYLKSRNLENDGIYIEDESFNNFISIDQIDKMLVFIKISKNLDLVKQLLTPVRGISIDTNSLITNPYIAHIEDLNEFYTQMYDVLNHKPVQKPLIATITSFDAYKAYALGVKVAELKNLPLPNIRLLISSEACKAYKLGIKFADLKDFDEKKIRRLTTENAFKAYAAGIKFAELKELTISQIDMLTSFNAIMSYSLGVDFAEIKDFSSERIIIFISPGACEAYRNGATLAKLISLPMEKTLALTSPEVYKAYQMGIKFTDLEDLSIEKILTLTSSNALEAYKSGMRFMDLKEMTVETIIRLTSPNEVMKFKHPCLRQKSDDNGIRLLQQELEQNFMLFDLGFIEPNADPRARQLVEFICTRNNMIAFAKDANNKSSIDKFFSLYSKLTPEECREMLKQISSKENHVLTTLINNDAGSEIMKFSSSGYPISEIRVTCERLRTLQKEKPDNFLVMLEHIFASKVSDEAVEKANLINNLLKINEFFEEKYKNNASMEAINATLYHAFDKNLIPNKLRKVLKNIITTSEETDDEIIDIMQKIGDIIGCSIPQRQNVPQKL